MPANNNPIYPLAAKPSTVAITAANTRTDGNGTIGTDIFLAFTAGTNGSRITKAQWTPVNSVISTATTATVGRLFLSQVGSGATTPGTNVWSIGEYTLVTQTPSPTAAVSPIVVTLDLFLPSGTFLLATTHHVPAANTSQHLTIYGADY